MKHINILKKIDSYKDEMINKLVNMLSIPAIGPSGGGDGEYDRAKYLYNMLKEIPFDKLEWIEAEDKRVKKGVRPNILAYYNGYSKERIWIVSHIDTVSPGDLSLWETDPFKPVIKDGKIIARGAEDDGQAVISSIYAVKALIESGEKPKYSIGLALVSDEEEGSKYGVKYLIENKYFDKDDMVIVPDAGDDKGSIIEVAEKTILWIKASIYGKQVHASTPDKGINTALVASDYTKEVYEYLYRRYNTRNDIFSPPVSTFEPTKREVNVENVNIIPGKDVQYFDCRILPEVNIEDVINDFRSIGEIIGNKYSAKIEVEVFEHDPAPPMTSVDSKIVKLVKESIKMLRGFEPRPIGIGGRTCAAYFRREGIDSVVWMTIDETAHQPNEYCKINNLINDSKVFALIPLLER